jgi:hypothetical protein
MALTPPLPPLKSPQFSLRTLFLLTTLVGCICALANLVSPLVLGGILFLAASIAAHVAGNKLGVTLREHASKQRIHQQQERPMVTGPLANAPAVPATRLRERKALGLVAGILTLAGGAAGLGLGVAGVHVLNRSPSTADLIVVGIAGAVLGALWTFALVGFLQVTSGAAWQALDASRESQGAPDKAAAKITSPESRASSRPQ